ncbi:hybrid sensor histidine kinase/response regulator [Noviherbaspirillum aridicola]|uniref:histidine kinase n=1 Tax=Noviherbaspirillum aridicola TaxID=2849687 RepID=A0ABQ4Q6J6_9BURK|nr:ATP-binding protein [Noviherbaspirillum aridicola]GIZ52753.1 hypothetical protein NCCP691_27670 [Noviherbaspirillum aridicola]
MRLRAHLTQLVVAALAPMVIVSAIALNKVRERHREAALASLQETARAASLLVERELVEVQTALRVLAVSQSLAEGDLERFHQKATAAMKGMPGWTILYDDQGRQLANTRVPWGMELPPRGVNVEQFGRILQEDRFHISSLAWAENVQRNVLLVEMPVRLGDRRFVLSHAILPEHINNTFIERSIPGSWVVALFDRDGITLARSHGAEQYVGKPAREDTRQAIRSGYSGVLRHVIRGEVEVYDVFVHSPLSGWTIAVGAPVSEIDSVVNQAALISGLGLLAAIVAATIAAWLIGRRVSRSVQGAVRSAATLGRGDLPEPPARSGVAEIDALHRTLQESGRMLALEKSQRRAAEAERNALLESEQQARREAERQNGAKDQFLAMLGHELRNPLAAITSAVEVLGIDGGGARGEGARTILARQVRHLERMVDDLLDVSRVMSGKVILDRQPLDLAATVSGCVATLKSTGRAERHVVTLSALRPVWVQADPVRIEQVVNNLLDNAVKYTPAGGSIRVEVRAEGVNALLCVQDSGVGIPAELQARIFEVFVQGERSLDRSQGGLGIGLALARRLARLHDGDVECRSDGADAGSSFTLRLPLAAAHQPVAGETRRPAPSCSVLLVDDHADARDMTLAMLENDGHRPRAAVDAEDAIRLALAERPDLALIDIGMPGTDGYALARAIRARPELAGIVLVALTGYGSPEDRARSSDAGFDLHMVKPLTRQKLDTACALLDRARPLASEA